MEGWRVRTELGDIKSLLHDAYSADEALGIHFAAATISNKELAQHLESTPLWVKRYNGHLASTVAVRLPWSPNPGPFALPHLGWVATATEFQGQGFAKQLIKDVINYLEENFAVPAVTLGTAKEHPWLVDAYQKLGFKVLTEVQLFSDHRTIYMIKILNRDQLLQVKDGRLQQILKERNDL